MRHEHIVILDVGKTLAKLTLWSPERRLLDRRTHANRPCAAGGYPCLDVEGITAWLAQTLTDFARQADIAAIIPSGHGAAACIVDDENLCLPPPDYEAELPAELRARYRRLRDPFHRTGSPALPCGLNLGAQLFRLDAVAPDAARRGRIVTWPQYWAWVLSGVAATEITSLGSHTDLWLPHDGRPSPMAVTQGWAGRLAPLRQAGDILGPVSQAWRERCGLPADCVVLCGLHDSNAALLAARRYPEVGGVCTVLSTGTWFVAMRSLQQDAAFDFGALSEARDCLVNIDAFGVPVPSSRFMGGREAEILEDGAPADPPEEQGLALHGAKRIAAGGLCILPTFQAGVGPFPDSKGAWTGRPGDTVERRAAISLYLALMSDVSLDLIGSNEALVIEGRFAGDAVFTRALASLRPLQKIYLSQIADNVALGALQLVDAGLPPQASLARAVPLDFDLDGYAGNWRALAAGGHRMSLGNARGTL